MSRGPGRLQRILAELFRSEPDNAFTTDELCRRAYPGSNGIAKKHRVAVLRAAFTLTDPYLHAWPHGKQYVFYNPYSLRSYQLAHLKAKFDDEAGLEQRLALHRQDRLLCEIAFAGASAALQRDLELQQRVLGVAT